MFGRLVCVRVRVMTAAPLPGVSASRRGSRGADAAHDGVAPRCARREEEARQKRHTCPETAQERMRLGDQLSTSSYFIAATLARHRRFVGTRRPHLGAVKPLGARGRRRQSSSPICRRARARGSRNKKGPALRRPYKRSTLGCECGDPLDRRARIRRQLTWPGRAAIAVSTGLNASVASLTIDLVDLGRLGDEALVGALGVFGLDLDRVLDRLGRRAASRRPRSCRRKPSSSNRSTRRRSPEALGHRRRERR